MGPASSLSLLLPAQPTPLVGREDELATIRRRLADEGTRLLTLTGPAGVGKTRLALAAADQLASRFPDGVVVVDLAPVRAPDLVLPAIAHAPGLTDTGQPPLLDRLRAFLSDRTILLVLDNFEQVLPAASLLSDLLTGCPRLALLVTSRVPLRLRWEQTLRLAPLPIPDMTTTLPPLEALAQLPSVVLFVERARARRADFALREKQAPLVARLVAQLDGLPLALELAAARLDALSLPTIARLLGDRLRLLRWEAPDLPERQRSLEAAVGWSYDLLSDPQRRLFRCLGVFAGRVSPGAVAAVAAVAAAGAAGAGMAGPRDEAGVEAEAGKREAEGAGEARALEGLASLAERSLVLVGRPDEEEAGDEGTADAEPAFGMLETVREYAEERLAEAGELAAARRAHARYFTALAERADPRLRGRGQRAWYFRLERERDNLRAALRWLLDRDDPAERAAGLRLAGALGWFWLIRGYHAEGRRWLAEALDRAPAAEPADAAADLAGVAARTRALLAAGGLLAQQGDFEQARSVDEEALALAQRRQDPADIARAFFQLGAGAVLAGDVAQGVPLLHEALGRWQGIGDPHHVGQTLFLLAQAAFARGDVEEAASLEADALGRLEAAGDARFAGTVRFNLAAILWRLGDLPRAARYVQEGLQVSLTFQDRRLLSIGVGAALAVIGERADPDERARLLGAGDALSQATGATPMWERVPAYQAVVRLRERLEREGRGAAYRAGRALPFGEVAALALRLLAGAAQAPASSETAPITAVGPARAPQPRQPPPDRRTGRNPLTERERDVLRLVAAGLSSKAIGQRLFLAPGTVNYHLTSAFRKLGVDTRAQAVAVAAQRGLL